MANVVSITVRARDATRDAFDSVQRSASNVGRSVGNAFSRMFDAAGALGSRIQGLGQQLGEFSQGPHAALAKVLVLLTLLPVLAQAAAIGITLGLGAAIAGIGIMAAAKTEQVKEAFKSLKEDVGGQLTEMSKPLIPVLTGIADAMRRAFGKLAPSLERAFATMAPYLASFASKMSETVGNLGPMIAKITANFGPLLDVLGSQLSRMVEHLASDFSLLADSADPRFVTVLVGGLTLLLDTIFVTLAALAQLGSGITSLIDLIPGINFDEPIDGLGIVGAALAGAASAANDASSAVSKLNEKMLEMANNHLGASGALINFEAAIDAATDAVKKNGQTLDINSQKGRENRSALDKVASTALDMREKLIAAGKDPIPHMERARAAFIRIAKQMHLSSAEANKLADDYGLVATKVKAIPGSKTITIKERGAAAAAAAALALAQAINSIPRSHTTTYDSTGPNRGPGKASGGIIGAAGGGPRSNMVWVGEQGPELVRLPFGSTVNSAGDSQRIASKGLGGAAAQTLNALLDSIDGKLSTIRSKMNATISMIKSKFDGKQEDGLVAFAKKSLSELEKLAAKRDKLTERLAESRQFASQLAQNAKSFAALTGLGATSGLGIKVGLEGKLGKLKMFAKALADLTKRGLSRVLLRQIAEAGPEEGLQLAQDFLAMDKATFNDVNKLQSQIDKTANGIGSSTAQSVYGTKELEKQAAALQKSMDKVADRFADKIAAALLKLNKGHSKKAAGGPAGGLTWVGEEGPELVDLPYGSNVTTAGQSRRMAATGGGQPIHIHLDLDGQTIAEVIFDPLRGVIRSIAGSGPNSVQAALS